MKEKLKYFLLGACSVVGGFLLYAWTRDTTESAQTASGGRGKDTPAHAVPPSATSAYVAHRKEQIQKQKAAPACHTDRPDTAATSLPDTAAAADATKKEHAVQNTGLEENNDK